MGKHSKQTGDGTVLNAIVAALRDLRQPKAVAGEPGPG